MKGEKRDNASQRFEDAMRELEAVVARIESGELALEEALAAFEQGVTLVRLLNDKLNLAEKQIEILSRDADGTVRLRPVADDERES